MDSAQHFSKIKRRSLVSDVYNELKLGILSGTIQAGTRLVETEISKQMGVSRAPIREAFRLLEVENLLDSQVNQGVYVKRLDKQQIWEIYTSRSLVEGYVAELAAKRASAEDIDRLKQARDLVLLSAERGDLEATVVQDFELHRLIWEIAQHKLLSNFLLQLEGQIRLFLTVQAPLFSNLSESVKDHVQIVDAIEKGDAEVAGAVMRKHIQEAGTLAIQQWGNEQGAP